MTASSPSPGGTIARQCLERVPVLMGEGNRRFFGQLSTEDVLLGNPAVCVQGDRVIPLVFPVAR